jgi:hypothetical protein
VTPSQRTLARESPQVARPPLFHDPEASNSDHAAENAAAETLVSTDSLPMLHRREWKGTVAEALPSLLTQ